MFRKPCSVAGKEALGGREAKAVRERCTVPEGVPYLAQVAATATGGDGEGAAALQRWLVESVLVPSKAAIACVKLVIAPFSVHGHDAPVDAVTAVCVDNVPLFFGVAQMGAAKKGTVGLPREPWVPTVMCIFRIAGAFHRLQLIDAAARSATGFAADAPVTGDLAVARRCGQVLDVAANALPPYTPVPGAHVTIPSDASRNVLGGADVMAAGVFRVLGTVRTDDACSITVLGNPIAFATGICLDGRVLERGGDGKVVRVCHTFGDELYKLCGGDYCAQPAPLVVAQPSPFAHRVLTRVAAPAVSDGAQASDKKAKPVPKRVAKQQQKEAAAAAPAAASDLSGAAAAAVDAASVFLRFGHTPLTFTSQRVMPLPAPRKLGDAVRDPDANDDDDMTDGTASAYSDGDDDAEAADAVLEGDSDDDTATASNMSDPSEHPAAATVDLPTTPDDAVRFALCEAVLRLTKGALPMALTTFVPEMLVQCLPPPFTPGTWDWSKATGKKALTAIRALCDGESPAAVTITEATKGVFQVTGFSKSARVVRAHVWRYRKTRFLEDNAVVLPIDMGTGDSSVEERADSLGARRIQQINFVYRVASDVPPAFIQIMADTDKKNKGIAVDKTTMLSGEQVRRQVRCYAGNNALISQEGVRVDATLQAAAKLAEAPSAPMPLKDLVTAVLDKLLTGYLIVYADGTTDLLKNQKRNMINLQRQLVRDHWHTLVCGLDVFGFDIRKCLATWPAALACSVELDEENPKNLRVHGDVCNRLINVLVSVVGIPSKYIAVTGRKGGKKRGK